MIDPRTALYRAWLNYFDVLTREDTGRGWQLWEGDQAPRGRREDYWAKMG